MKKTLLLLLSCLSLSLAAIAQNIIYVNINVSGGANNGTSWANAYNNLATAIDNASEGKQIWVAKGTYEPAIFSGSFSMKNNVAIYGGFAGGETSLGQRNYMANLTILRGDYTILNNNNGLTATAILDGFTITGTNDYNDGKCVNFNVSPTIRNCVFTGASNGIFNRNSFPTIINCSFVANRSNGISNINSSPTIVNCLIAGNSQSGIYNEASSSSIIVNTTIAGNNGNALFNSNSTPLVRNSIVWGGVVGSYTASHSLIKDKTDESNGNISAGGVTENHIFNNYAGNDYTLKSGSPALNKGDNSLYIGLNAATLDLAGNKRLIGSKIDLGAYEHQTLVITPDVNNTVYVNSNADGTGDGSSWNSALTQLADALKAAKTNTAIHKIYVAKGTYKPLYSPASGNFGLDAGRDNAFLLVPNVAIYGGFAGNETALEQRNWRANQTILSGDLDNNDALTDGISTTINGNNAHHVVLSGGDMGASILDGFTITGGQANGSGELWVASGLNNFSQNFSRTDAAGIFNRESGGNFPAPTIRNCRISGNTASNLGGGMANYNSSPTIIDCIISRNSAGTTAGGMRNSGNAATKVIGTLISGNTAPSGGGVSGTTSATVTFTNCTIVNNGEGLNVSNGWPQLNNSIVWDGVVGSYHANYSLIKDKTDGNNGNVSASGLTANEIFDNYAGGDYILKTGSRALNSGGNNLYTGLNASTLDLLGNRRLISKTIDLGAYEHQTLIITPDANNIVYVNSNADGTGDGSSWGFAVTQFQAAIDGLPANGGQVWVAKGTYKHSGGFFSMKKDAAIYGGFTGNEVNLAQRNYIANPTILTRIFNHNNELTATAILDGVTITDEGDYGMHNINVSPTIRNCVFTRNYDHGILNENAFPTLINCSFVANNGNGIANKTSSPTIVNCLITGNRESGLYNETSSSPTVINTTIAGNNGNALFSINSTPILYNTIAWGGTFGNYTASHSLIKDKTDESNGNISASGLTEASIFNNYAGSDYTLKSGSPALNQGDNSLYTGLNAASLDLTGNKRLIGSKIDIGAYENQTLIITPDANNIVYVNSNADGTGDGSSWAYATTQLQAAINSLPAGGGQVWVAKGTYQPAGGSSFTMRKDVAIYGGFAGGETSIGQRNYMANLTTLKGNDQVVIFNDDNELTATAILDGFTITAELRDGMVNMSSSPKISNCVFTGNGFDGMSNGRNSSPIVNNCVFTENKGNGMGNHFDSSPILINCIFTANLQSGIYNVTSSSPTIINSAIVNNLGNGLFNSDSTPLLHNAIVWDNIIGSYTAKNSLIKGKTDVTNGNINGAIYNENQIFNNYTNKDYSLKVGSPTINKGDNALYTGSGLNLNADKDLAGNPRFFDGQIDIGAYESQVPVPLPVNFGKFTAALQNNRVKLEWNTFSETNNEAFTVYRSTDGLNYTKIARQASKGNGANSYVAYDNSPLNGLNYYRLKQQDTDGTTTELGDDAVNFSLRNEEVKAWPNPVEKILKLSFPAGKYQSLRLADVSGRKLQEHTLNKTQSQAELDLSSYPKGVYLIALKGNNGNHLLKVLK